VDPVAWVFGPQRSWVDVCNKCQVYIHPTDSKFYRLWIWPSGQASTRISWPSQSRIPHPHKRFLFSDPTTVVWCIAGGGCGVISDYYGGSDVSKDSYHGGDVW
jgi:hypothetical protein